MLVRAPRTLIFSLLSFHRIRNEIFIFSKKFRFATLVPRTLESERAARSPKNRFTWNDFFADCLLTKTKRTVTDQGPIRVISLLNSRALRAPHCFPLSSFLFLENRKLKFSKSSCKSLWAIPIGFLQKGKFLKKRKTSFFQKSWFKRDSLSQALFSFARLWPLFPELFTFWTFPVWRLLLFGL